MTEKRKKFCYLHFEMLCTGYANFSWLIFASAFHMQDKMSRTNQDRMSRKYSSFLKLQKVVEEK